MLILSFGCDRSQVNDKKSHITIDIDTLSVDDTIYFSQVFDDYEIIPLETNENCIIGEVTSIRFCNDYIVILDRTISKSVFVFDLNGKFIRKIGAVGKGPGEYLIPKSISTNDKTKEIFVYDGSGNRVNIYSLSGVFKKSLRLDQQGLDRKSIEVYDNVIYTNSTLNPNVDNVVYGVDYNGKLVRAKLKNKFKFEDNELYSDYNHFFKTPDGLRYRSWLYDEVYKISDNSILPLISLKTKKYSKVEEINNTDITDANLNSSKNKPLKITNYVEIDSFSILEYCNEEMNFYTVFCDLKNKNVKGVTIRNFKNDLIQLLGRQMGYFYTSHNDYLVSIVCSAPFFMKMQDFVEKVKDGRIKSKNHSLDQVTIESNPIIIMYKCKENPEIW